MSLAVREVVLPLAEFALEVTLDFDAQTTALYGPSGAGKTTLLELIAGLRKPQHGRIALDDRVLTDARVFVPPRARRIGYVPQDDALFPHLDVRRNVFYGARESTAQRSADVLDVLEITPLLDRNVGRLSGGERKRIALARALLTDPELLLLDEPLAGVDVALRDRVLDYLARVRREFPVPAIWVTHQMEEVEAVCDEVVLLDRGRITGQRRL
jgi:molybdate transport system ATP-binding protein